MYELANVHDSDGLKQPEEEHHVDDVEIGYQEEKLEPAFNKELLLGNEKQSEEQQDTIDIIRLESASNKAFAEAELLTVNHEEPPSKETKQTDEHIVSFYLRAYFKKFLGVPGMSAPAMTKPLEMCISSILAFIGIFLVAVTDEYYLLPNFYAGHSSKLGIKMLTGAYAATSVLIYEAYKSPLAQPRNVFGSYTVCSFVGVSTRLVCDIIGLPRYATGAFAVGIAIFFMNITKTVHPPGKTTTITTTTFLLIDLTDSSYCRRCLCSDRSDRRRYDRGYRLWIYAHFYGRCFHHVVSSSDREQPISFEAVSIVLVLGLLLD